jgi:methyltransferase family protein/C-methyltransferase-like protein
MDLEPSLRLCRGCGQPTPEPFFRIERVPVQDGLLWPTPETATRAPTGRIELVFCGSCGYVGNRAFDSRLLRYDPGYDISLHYSPVYRRFVDELVDRLITTYDLRGKAIIEIGSGKGDFLRALCARGGNRGLGFDPTSTVPDDPEGSVRILREFYSEAFAGEEADLLCCRHVLNSIEDLRGFLGMVRRTLGSRTRSVVYFEVPDGAVVFRRRVVWNVVYEHCSYFTAEALACLFARSGFSVRSVAPCFLDEYLGIEANPDEVRELPADDSGKLEELGDIVEGFGDLYRSRVARWSDWLSERRRHGRRVVLWGSGARAVSFLSALDPGPEVPYLVDINPKRQGLFMPRTAQPVAAPEALLSDPVDSILITNPAFVSEIRSQAAELGVRGEIVVLD